MSENSMRAVIDEFDKAIADSVTDALDTDFAPDRPMAMRIDLSIGQFVGAGIAAAFTQRLADGTGNTRRISVLSEELIPASAGRSFAVMMDPVYLYNFRFGSGCTLLRMVGHEVRGGSL